MKELTLETMIAVFEEIFGTGLFWLLIGAAVLVTIAFVYVLVRDRAMSMRKFLLAQLAMPFGAVAAVAFVLQMTHSNLQDIGGPIDVVVLFGVAVAGAVGTAILIYTMQSLLHRP